MQEGRVYLFLFLWKPQYVYIFIILHVMDNK